MKRVIYKVGYEENLETLSKRYGVPKQNITPQNFCEGDRVIIDLSIHKTYIVMPGDTKELIAQKLSISQEKLDNILGSEKIFVGKHIFI